MPKTEVLATSFILTLTIISTVPVPSADLQCKFIFFERQESQKKNKKFSYALAKTTIAEYTNYSDREVTNFSVSNSLNKFSTKIKQEIWEFNNFNVRWNLWKETNFSDATQPIMPIAVKNVTESNFGLTQLSFSEQFIPELTFLDINTKTWTQQKIDSLLKYQEAWTPNLNNTDPSNTEPEIKIVAEPLPIISLIITSLFCLFSAKKSQTSIDNTNSQN